MHKRYDYAAVHVTQDCLPGYRSFSSLVSQLAAEMAAMEKLRPEGYWEAYSLPSGPAGDSISATAIYAYPEE